ncbi:MULTISPECIES: 2Fe-2S iron-sulfur cluster-binding protein [unclassified Frankia]|uniref:2Fe-2S iron-sulfur cluster-binding protein n=1 Tax=unclassified Frankia TaxID=2632575 RepID=UPI002AD24749|nr:MULTISPECIES: 2Fe-2S iron-sulfur cluster-binding protein [unclassified Frankia]
MDVALSAQVTVTPSGIVLAVAEAETVFAAARRCGYWWPTVCDGVGTCRTCVLQVSAGAENCGPIDDLEDEGLRAIGPGTNGRIRLACQLRVTGPVVVVKRGVRRAEELRGL